MTRKYLMFKLPWFLKNRSTKLAKIQPTTLTTLKPDPYKVQKLIDDIYLIVKQLDLETDEEKFIPWIRSYKDKNIKIETK